MRSLLSFFVCTLLFSNFSFAQKLKTVTLIQQRSYYLNGGARAQFGGKSRVEIKIDLPPKTKSWYYSFSTSPDEGGSRMLNLGLQLAGAISAGSFGSMLVSSIQVPAGSGSVDVFVLPPGYRDIFLQKQDDRLKYFPDVSLNNVKQAVQSVDTRYGQSFYLGLKNPSMMNGINVQIEVVAVVEEESELLEQADLYYSLGCKALERGDSEKCLEFCNKALEIAPDNISVKFKIGLVHLLQDSDVAIADYVSALAACKSQSQAKSVLINAMADCKKLRETNPTLKYLADVEQMLDEQVRKLE